MKEISAECCERIIQSIKTGDKLKELSNNELADILIETLWAEYPLMSPQSDLLNEVIDRLKGFTMPDESVNEGAQASGAVPKGDTFGERCHWLRSVIKDKGDMVIALKKHSRFNGEEAYPKQFSGMLANIMLAYRHLEDARMRIGKILQAADDGVSILDK